MKMCYNIPYAGTTVTYPQVVYIDIKIKANTSTKKITTNRYVKVDKK